jgi:hypothetical protein
MSEVVGGDASSRIPDGRPKTGTSNRNPSAGNRFSIASTETGESSKRNSVIIEDVSPNSPDGQPPPVVEAQNVAPAKPAQDGRGSHRSHRSRGSASFLVSNLIFDLPIDTANGVKSTSEIITRRRDSPGGHKGKVAARTPEMKHKKNRSSLGLSIGGSPLAANVTNVVTEKEEKTRQLGIDGDQDSSTNNAAGRPADAPKSTGIDVESAQIVNLALNLSESRRQAARRNVSSPIPPTITGFGEGFTGGSLRQHLQAQRRSSRNVSPKPERGDRAYSGTPRVVPGQRMESPLQIAFGAHHEGDYQYQFSASTLARAEKAKNAIELMAQYRRLLQYMPPLKPQIISRATTKSPPNTAIGSPGHWAMPPSLEGSDYRRLLGRPYNPLQYIRNRKVRARERKTIDGESQGFGDVDRVASWVDRVARSFSGDEYQSSDYIVLPRFAKAHDTTATPTTSPQSTLGRSQGTAPKAKRPRVDWLTNPADMLADVYWLEQDDNKKLIEDNRERKIFPQSVELTRPVSSHKGDEPIMLPESKPEVSENKLRLDTKLPIFNSLRSSSDRHSDSSRGRGRHSITKIYDDLHRKGHEHHLLKSHQRSSSESSESNPGPRLSGHRRNATAGSNNLNSDILEKQMLEILAKESRENSWEVRADVDGQAIPQSARSSIAASQEKMENIESGVIGVISSNFASEEGHQRKDSRSSQHVTGRSSLEVPETRGRSSLDGLDSTAPNSPLTKPSNVAPFFVPSIALDLSPTPSRRSSPTRQPALSKVKSKINSLHDRSRNHSRSGSTRQGSIDIEKQPERNGSTLDVPSIPDSFPRSLSPDSKILHRKTDEGAKSSSSKAGSIRRKAEELPSGIKGLFKSGRNRVNNLIWNKDISPGSVASSNSSSDDSDVEDGISSVPISRITTFGKGSKLSTREASGELPPRKEPKHYDLPVFRSPFEQRGRTGAPIEDVESPESDYISQRQRIREQRRISRQQFLNPPRIDVHGASPSSSPELRATNPSSRNSDVSDLENQRSSSLGVQSADARLNSILGIPGHLGRHLNREGLPVTGLTHTFDSRRPSAQSANRERNWSRYDRAISATRGPITKREVARIQALLLSSGIKAREINRRAVEVKDIREYDKRFDYTDIVPLDQDPPLIKPVPKYQTHILAAQIVSRDIQISSQVWHETVSTFSNQTINDFLDRIEDLQDRIIGRNGLSEMTRIAEREADDVSKDLVTSKTLAVKELLERMGTILRRRRRRFRWIRRAGWVLLEWVLVGVMWWVWLVVVLIGFVRGTVRGVIGGVRWLLWL